MHGALVVHWQKPGQALAQALNTDKSEPVHLSRKIFIFFSKADRPSIQTGKHDRGSKSCS